MQRLLLITFVFLPLLAVYHSTNAQTSELRVVTEGLRKTALTSELELSGSLRPLRESRLSVSADAVVISLHVDVGSRVKKGDLLLELDNGIAKQAHQRALALLSAAETNTAEAVRLRDEALRLKQQRDIVPKVMPRPLRFAKNLSSYYFQT
jgi:membrane fusion protein, multidrug efflux system